MDETTATATSKALMALLQAMFVELLQRGAWDRAAAERVLQMADEITQRQPDGGLHAADLIGSFRQLADLIARHR